MITEEQAENFRTHMKAPACTGKMETKTLYLVPVFNLCDSCFTNIEACHNWNVFHNLGVVHLSFK